MRSTLLMIDDSELDRAIFNEIFKNDYTILCAATAGEGVELVRSHIHSIAVVVLDICLQRGSSGFSVLEDIRRLEGGARLPVILLTAEAEPEWVYRGVSLGATDFLSKPLSPEGARRRIKAIIEEMWGGEDTHSAGAPSGRSVPGGLLRSRRPKN